ncbi:MAG TPA: hypothetical protein VH502_15490 [Actinoplanes sp.]
MKPDLTVDTTEVRSAASDLSAAGRLVSAGAMDPPDPVSAPRWATSDATALATEAIRRQLSELGAGITATAHEIVAAVTDYDAADDRAAFRMRAAA